MPDLDAVIQAKLAAADELLKLPGVTGVDVGNRKKGGQATDELAIRVYVEHKRPLNEVPAESRIPTEIGGFKTDVIEKGHNVLISLEDVHQRPIVGGLEITRVRKDFKGFDLGSLCCFVTASRKTGPNAYALSADVYMLSAAHVLEPKDESVDDRVYQPRPVLGFGNLCAAKADINWGNDAGLALLGQEVTWKNDIYGVGPIRGIADPVIDQVVRKQGRTTGLTIGKVSGLSATYINPTLGRRFDDLFMIEATEPFVDSGDSGGPVFTGGEDIKSNPPVLLGLMHAMAGNKIAFVSKISNIFKFNVPHVSHEGPIQLSLAGRSGKQGWPNAVDRSVPMSLHYVGPTEIITGNNIQGKWTATGENGDPYTFAVDQVLPQGLRLSPEGVFSGSTNAAPMEWKGSVTATDRTGTKSAPVAWEFICRPPIEVTPSSLPDAVEGAVYFATLSVRGGTEPYTFPILDLGNGLRLDSTGLISGTPRPGASGLSASDPRHRNNSSWGGILVTDKFGNTRLFGIALTILPPPIEVTPSSLPDAVVGQPYHQQLQASGGTVPYTYEKNYLPDGLRLDSTGLLSGTPRVQGTMVNQIISVTDARGYKAFYGFNMQIRRP